MALRVYQFDRAKVTARDDGLLNHILARKDQGIMAGYGEDGLITYTGITAVIHPFAALIGGRLIENDALLNLTLPANSTGSIILKVNLEVMNASTGTPGQADYVFTNNQVTIVFQPEVLNPAVSGDLMKLQFVEGDITAGATQAVLRLAYGSTTATVATFAQYTRKEVVEFAPSGYILNAGKQALGANLKPTDITLMTDDDVNIKAASVNVTGPLNVSGPIGGTVTGGISGNAATATALQTARTIQTSLSSTSVASFNGTANVTPGVSGILPIGNGGTGVNTGNAPTTTKLFSPRYLLAKLDSLSAQAFDGSADATAIGVSGVLPAANGGTGNIYGTANTATQLATPRNLKVDLTTTNDALFNGNSDLVHIGVSGILPLANGGTGNNAGKAAALTVARTIALTGDVTGTVNFDGSANVSMATTATGGTTTVASLIAPAANYSMGANAKAYKYGKHVFVQLDVTKISAGVAAGGNILAQLPAGYYGTATGWQVLGVPLVYSLAIAPGSLKVDEWGEIMFLSVPKDAAGAAYSFAAGAALVCAFSYLLP